MVIALVLSLALVTVLYLAINFAYVRALGFEGVAKSDTVASDVLKLHFGATGAKIISFIVCGLGAHLDQRDHHRRRALELRARPRLAGVPLAGALGRRAPTRRATPSTCRARSRCS